jgi:hypothetical protein
MYSEIVGTIMASLGGASVIALGFSHFLGKVWANRIAEATSARFKTELEDLRARNAIVIEDFRSKSSIALKENEYFAGISQEFYQQFFKERVNTYLNLLTIKNDYISKMQEDFVVDEIERWGEIYHRTYTLLRKLIIEKQLYVSNELDNHFSTFRSKASQYIKEADIVEAYSYDGGDPRYSWENPGVDAVYNKFASETGNLMSAVMDQIGADAAKLRARIDIDKA